MWNKSKVLPALAATVALLTATAAPSAKAQSTALVQSGHLSYLGNFKLPVLSGNGFGYGGTAITYNPARNSLFVGGYAIDRQIAEVSIPALGGTATILQALTSSAVPVSSVVPQGSANQDGAYSGNEQVFVGGNLVYRSRLYTSAFIYYDGPGRQAVSHFNRALDLRTGGAVGPYRVGAEGAGIYSGYMAHIPAEWQAKLGGPALTGNCCLSIIGRTSYGPSVSSFDPEATTPSAKTLVYYDSDHQTLGLYESVGQVNPVFNGTTRITGVFFPEGTASVLFFGSTGIGVYCYGEGAACGDPGSNSKGEHAPPYRGYIWAYNANDLAAVRSGAKQPWEVRPYATWELGQLGNLSSDFSTGGAAYDPATRRVYLSEKYGDADGRPLIHVYQVSNASQLKTPKAPTNLSAQ